MHTFHSITTLLLLQLLTLEATAWPTKRLIERDDDSVASTDDIPDDTASDDNTNMDLAMKAFAFNFGYTALSANSSCGGTEYPLEYACTDGDAYHYTGGTWTMALDCGSQNQKCYAVPGEEIADDPIIDCKSFDEAYDLFTELLDDCALGDPSGQADIFGFFYGTSDSSSVDTSTELQKSATPMDTSSPTVTATVATATAAEVQATNVRTGRGPEMACAPSESTASGTDAVTTPSPDNDTFTSTSTAMGSGIATDAAATAGASA